MRVRRDRGQIVPLAALVLVLACGAVVLVARLGEAAVDRARAQTAADAAALAGVAAGQAEAEATATANGAIVERYVEHEDGSVTVVARVGRAVAAARAELTSDPPSSPHPRSP